MAADEPQEIRLDGDLDEEQMLALITAVLWITDRTNVNPEQALRIVKQLVTGGLVKVMQRRTATGRLEIGFELRVD